MGIKINKPLQKLQRCKKCGLFKVLETDFPRAANCKSGYLHSCKSCVRAAQLKREKADPEKYLAIKKAWRDANRKKVLEYQRQYRARKKLACGSANNDSNG